MSQAKILIADDTQVIRTVLSRKLTEKGYEVTAVPGGVDAVQQVGENAATQFDLIFLDIHMPDLNGIEALKQIRATHSPSQLPVIMITAKDEEEDVVHCFEAGANDFVAKPVNFPILFARLETHLKLKRAIEELGQSGGG